MKSPAGSSPRGRGKPREGGLGCRRVGLIPAWAGKTCRRVVKGSRGRAHPRVGGENRKPPRPPLPALGSSPRGRGKLFQTERDALIAGLIPAWAGKTNSARRRTSGKRAHPRVGGENLVGWSPARGRRGSSPRGRGRPALTMLRASSVGLIPAWAGKTRLDDVTCLVCRAHPRVGGENAGSRVATVIAPGSSPRGRGKP